MIEWSPLQWIFNFDAASVIRLCLERCTVSKYKVNVINLIMLNSISGHCGHMSWSATRPMIKPVPAVATRNVPAYRDRANVSTAISQTNSPSQISRPVRTWDQTFISTGPANILATTTLYVFPPKMFCLSLITNHRFMTRRHQSTRYFKYYQSISSSQISSRLPRALLGDYIMIYNNH